MNKKSHPAFVFLVVDPVSNDNSSYYESKIGCEQCFMLTLQKSFAVLFHRLAFWWWCCVCVYMYTSAIFHCPSKDELWCPQLQQKYVLSYKCNRGVLHNYYSCIVHGGKDYIYIDLRFSKCISIYCYARSMVLFFPLDLKYWVIIVIHFTCSESERMRGGGREGDVVWKWGAAVYLRSAVSNTEALWGCEQRGDWKRPTDCYSRSHSTSPISPPHKTSGMR